MTTEAQVIIAAAAVKADRINDLLGIRSEAIREHNRLSWAWQDLEHAGEPEGVWGPVRDRAREVLGKTKF